MILRICLLTFKKNSQRGLRPAVFDNQYQAVDQLSFGFASVLAVEALDAACGIHQLLFAGEERMTTGTNLKSNF